jgi:hypothetical protein
MVACGCAQAHGHDWPSGPISRRRLAAMTRGLSPVVGGHAESRAPADDAALLDRSWGVRGRPNGACRRWVRLHSLRPLARNNERAAPWRPTPAIVKGGQSGLRCLGGPRHRRRVDCSQPPRRVRAGSARRRPVHRCWWCCRRWRRRVPARHRLGEHVLQPRRLGRRTGWRGAGAGNRRDTSTPTVRALAGGTVGRHP